jgi:ketosteroid isomerase-like protein
MSQENAEIVRRAYDRWATGDFRAGAADLDPHVVFVVQPPFLEPGVYLGQDGVRDYMSRFLEQWEHYTIEAEHFQAVGDTILVRIYQRGKGKVSGIDSELRSYMLFTFRGRKIVRIENVLDEAKAHEAAGLSE